MVNSRVLEMSEPFISSKSFVKAKRNPVTPFLHVTPSII